MNVVIYDTYDEYVASGSNLKDDLCFIKNMGSWYQGGHKKPNHTANSMLPPVSPCGCGKLEEPKPFIHPDCCDDDCCSCHPSRPPLSIVDINGIKYWTWEGRLLTDCDGNFIQIDGQSFNFNGIKDWVKNYVADALISYLKNSDLGTITVDGTPYHLDAVDNISITNCHCSNHNNPEDDPHYGKHKVTYHLTNCTNNRNNVTEEWVADNSAFSVTLIANNEYVLLDDNISCTMGTRNITASSGVIDISNVVNDVTITASAVSASSLEYSINFIRSHCNIEGPISRTHGQSGTWTITPDNGYTLRSVYYQTEVNGQNIPLTLSNNQVTINNVTSNIWLTAIAEQNGSTPTDTFTWYAGWGENSDDRSHAVPMTSSGNRLSGTVSTEIPNQTYYLYVWVPSNKEIEVPQRISVTEINGYDLSTMGGITQEIALKYEEIKDGFKIYRGYLFEIDRNTHELIYREPIVQYVGTETYKFN